MLLSVAVPQAIAQTVFPGVNSVSVGSNVSFASAPFTTSQSNDSSDCDYSSYPDYCIPPPPPSLDCDDVDGKDFTVFQPDPHGFDRDKDGEGCETSE